jgi:aryl-alcohol dehydrogenase-like predicted oxidoreductase
VVHERTLGQDLRVSATEPGCMGLSQSYDLNPGDCDDMIAVLRGAVEHGVAFFDTAEVYGSHVNEELVGEGRHPGRRRPQAESRNSLLPSERSIQAPPHR